MKSPKILAISCFFLLFAGVSVPQSANKRQAAPPKTATPARDSAAKAQSKEAKAPDEDAVPQAAPNALFPAVVAEVNGKPILGRELEQWVRVQLVPDASPEWKNLREDYRGQLTLASVNYLITSKLLYQKAIDSGVKATDLEVQTEVQIFAKGDKKSKVPMNYALASMIAGGAGSILGYKSDAEMNLALAGVQMDRTDLEKILRQNLIISKFLDENINKKIVVTPEETAKYYSSHPAEFQHPDIVRTSHILISPAGDTEEQDKLAKDRAEALLVRVKKGEDFAKLARENSMDGSASQGGDIGFAAKESLTPEYAEAAFSLPLGGIKLIKSQYGYHIVKVTDKKKEGLSTLEEVKDQLTTFLKEQKAQIEETKLVNDLRNQGKVEILIPAGQQLK